VNDARTNGRLAGADGGRDATLRAVRRGSLGHGCDEHPQIEGAVAWESRVASSHVLLRWPALAKLKSASDRINDGG